MSYPNIPDINPNLDLDREQVKNVLFASVALEELGLSHIINTEAEKIQYVLGTLEGSTPPEPPTINGILEVNDSVESSLRGVIKNQMLLQFKLEDILKIPPKKIKIHRNVVIVIATYDGEELIDNDVAYYYTENLQNTKQMEVIV